MYNKLFTKILDSSIWLESMATRLVWVTLIAAMDEEGFCAFSAPQNLANRAIVPLPDALEAIAVLEAPDVNSADKDNDGRRIERVPGGWIVLNAEKYRELVTKVVIQEQTRVRVRRHREKLRNASALQPVTGNGDRADETHSNENVTPSRAVARAKARSTDDVVRNEADGEQKRYNDDLSYVRAVLESQAPDTRAITDADLARLMEAYGVSLMTVAIVEKRNYLSGKGVDYLDAMFASRVTEGWTEEKAFPEGLMTAREFVDLQMAMALKRARSGYVVRITLVEFVGNDAQLSLFDDEEIA